MKISIESTSKFVTFQYGGRDVAARIWEGHTDDGTPVHAYITRICPTIPKPLPQSVADKFARQLLECAAPSAAVQAIPLRMIL